MPYLFWISFCVTFLLLLASLWAGITKRRKLHLLVAPASFVSLTITVILTEQLVSSRVFPQAELDFHLNFAYSAAALGVPVILTGVWLARSGAPTARRVHRVCITLFMLAVVVATTTGIWSYSLSVPK